MSGNFLIRCHPRWIATLVALVVLLSVGCRAGGPAQLEDAALSSRDVPDGWQRAEFDDEEWNALWESVPELLAAKADASLLMRAFESDDGLHGAATILIQASEEAALPETSEDVRVLAPLGQLLERQDDLLRPSVRGGDPGAYFAASDAPLPGSLRSRLVRLLDDGYLFSDSTIFSSGPVLAVVTVWYPEEEGPFREVLELAAEVEARLREYLDSG